VSSRLSPETLAAWSPAVLSGGLLVFALAHHLTDALGVDVAPQQKVVASGAGVPAPQAADLGLLVEWSLFGKAADDESPFSLVRESIHGPEIELPEDDENTVLPPVTVDVKVQGIAYSRDKSRAYVILQVEGDAPREFRPGDTLRNGVQLRAVRPLEVVILNQGRLEVAALPVAPAPMTSEEDSTTIPAQRPQGRPTPFSILGGDRPPGSWRRLDSLRGSKQ